MKKIIFAFLVLSLLIISGCKEAVTGKSVAEPQNEAKVSDERINECVKACNDGTKPEEYYVNSCSSIMKYGGGKVLEEYISACGKV